MTTDIKQFEFATEEEKSKLASWIEALWANDQFRYELMSTPVVVHHAILVDDRTLEIKFEFWDDEHHVSDAQENFLFDIEDGHEYGVNFPTHLLHLVQTWRYQWKTAADREALCNNLIAEEFIDQDIANCDWDDPKIPDDLVGAYINGIDAESMSLMLIEKYDAAKGLPSFIPERLTPQFFRILKHKKST